MYILCGILFAAGYLLYDYLQCKEDTYVIDNMKMVIAVAIATLGPIILLACIFIALAFGIGWLAVQFIYLLENVEIRIKR